ncbi:MAG: hypothetical protein RIT81_27415 [Deltaproteobacteria bacterium]
MAKSDETKFLRGELGVDGEAIEEEVDAGEVERGKALDALAHNRAYLGREMLTWLLWRTASGDTIAVVEDAPVSALLVGDVVLRGLAGEATELAVKGHTSAYAEIVRIAIDRGLLVHRARLRIQHGEQVFEVTLDAENLAFRAANLPALLQEEEDDRLLERLWLTERLGQLVDALWGAFMKVRTAPKWARTEVPAIKAWLLE